MDQPLIFPPDVVSAHPFTSPEGAVAWLHHARIGDYGPMADVVYGLDDRLTVWTLDPILTADLPAEIVTLTGDQGEVYGVTTASISPFVWVDDGTTATRVGPAPGTPAIVYDPPHPRMTAGTALLLHRLHRGYEWAARQQFDAAAYTDRLKWAAILGDFERSAAHTGAAFVAIANRWISTAWSDALNTGSAVIPDPINPPPSPGGFTLIT